MLIPTSFAFDSHVIDDVDAFAQYLDITQTPLKNMSQQLMIKQ
jgi:hypothetical protein